MQRSLHYDDVTIWLGPGTRPGSVSIQLLDAPSGESAPAHQVDLASALGTNPDRLARRFERSVLASIRQQASAARNLEPLAAIDASALDPRAVGRRLFDLLFRGRTKQIFERLLIECRGTPNRALRLRLAFDPEASGALLALPWEVLYQHEGRAFLGREIATPVVRYLQTAAAPIGPPPLERLRVLLVLSSPEGVAALATSREHGELASALEAHPAIDLEILERPTLEYLRERVRDRPFDVLHIVSHGVFDDDDRGCLMLERESGEAHVVSGEQLAANLKAERRPRLVFLNACVSGRMPRAETGHDPFQGAASALLVGGIPAVIAMQFPISDAAAVQFSRTFYRRLAKGDLLETAITEARIAIDNRFASWEWVTPVLMLSTKTGAFFTPKDAGATSEGKPTSARNLAHIRALIEAGDFDPALAHLDSPALDAPDLLFERALARLRGRRPQRVTLSRVRAAEADLLRAQRVSDSVAAHVLLLLALLRHDFYVLNGMLTPDPTPIELISAAREASIDRGEIQRLLRLVPTAPSAIRSAIEDLTRRRQTSLTSAPD